MSPARIRAKTSANCRGCSAPTFTLVASGTATTLTLGDAGGGVSALSGLSAGDDAGAGTRNGKLSVRTRGIGTFTSNDGDGNNAGFTRTIGGGATGFDAAFSEGVRLGMSLGHARADAHGRNEGGEASSDNYRVGVYAGWTNGAWFANADPGATWSRIDTETHGHGAGREGRDRRLRHRHVDRGVSAAGQSGEGKITWI